MPTLAHRSQRVVEAHGNVADEEAARLGDFQSAGGAFHESVGLKGREGCEFAGEMFGEVDAETFAHCGEVEREVAHHAHDRLAAAVVLLGHKICPVQRRAARVHGGLPRGQFLFVLPVGVGDLRDGAHAERINIRTGARAVTLKISLELFVALRHGEFVIGLREVVHTDIDVLIVRRQFFDDELEHFQFRRGRGQNFLLQNFLCGLDPRDVRVAEHGEPVGRHLEHGVERVIERRNGLVRQAVDEVEVHGAKAKFAHPVERLLRHRLGLDAVDRLLHLRIKILHAHRGAVEADLRERNDVFARKAARVNFDAGLDVRRELKMFVDDFTETADFIGLEERGRAAAEVELNRLALLVDERRHLRDFATERFDVAHAAFVIERYDSGATAEPAERLAERDVEI